MQVKLDVMNNKITKQQKISMTGLTTYVFLPLHFLIFLRTIFPINNGND